MPFPPLWKVRREINRVGVKTAIFVSRRFYDPCRRPIYDLTAQRRLRVSAGKLPLTDRVAVFVVYQPKGLASSIFLTLEHLRNNGYSVLLVSNGRLDDAALAATRQNAAVVLERPNVGYDFGAYRDGIRHLWSLNHDPARLVLINDSTWFPLRRDDDSLARMEALDADLAGHIFKTEDEHRPQNDHVESHLLMISKDFFKSNDFRRFWTRYPMSNFRARTIEVGEKAFSQMTIRTGRSLRTLMAREWLLSVLDGLDDAALKTALDHTIDIFSSGKPDLSSVRRLASMGYPWREDFIAWTDKALRNSLYFLLSATFVMPALVYGRMGFAKKSSDIRFHYARQKLLELEASGMIPPLNDVVRREISEAVRSFILPKGQPLAPRNMPSQTASAGG